MINTIIAKASTSEKVIDFRDGLVLAHDEDYAMLFGVGGGKHAPVSVIKVTICDFSKGKGDLSVTSSANLELETIALLRAVAEDKLLHPNTAQAQPAPAQPKAPEGAVLPCNAWDSFVSGLSSLLKAEKRGSASRAELNGICNQLKVAYDAGRKSLEDNAQSAAAPAPAKKSYSDEDQNNYDFKHNQVRVNVYKKGADGLPPDFAPVSTLTITHNAGDGRSVVKYPWVVKIVNGTAKVKVSGIGATSYVGSTFKKTSEVFMHISDMDMFRMMDACQRFINTYALGFGIPLVKNGVAQKNREREEFRNNRM